MKKRSVTFSLVKNVKELTEDSENVLCVSVLNVTPVYLELFADNVFEDGFVYEPGLEYEIIRRQEIFARHLLDCGYKTGAKSIQDEQTTMFKRICDAFSQGLQAIFDRPEGVELHAQLLPIANKIKTAVMQNEVLIRIIDMSIVAEVIYEELSDCRDVYKRQEYIVVI